VRPEIFTPTKPVTNQHSTDQTTFGTLTRYDDMIWRVFVPAAEQLPGRRSHDEVNSQLKELATALVILHPGDYAIWLAKAFRRGIEQVAVDFVRNPVSLALLLLTLMVGAVRAIRFLRGDSWKWSFSQQAGILFVMSLTLALMKLAVVILVSIPIERMTMPVGLLIPPLLVTFLADVVPGLCSRQCEPSLPGGTERP